MVKIKVGDIFEIKTPKGNAYLHYVYKDNLTGDLIRILPGTYAVTPSETELLNLAQAKELYVVFFPLAYAYKQGIVQKVGSYGIDNFIRPRYMRTKHMVRGEFLGWHIVDTSTWQRQLVKKLTSDQLKLNPWGLWNDTLLVERITEGWMPEKWTS